MVCVRWLNDLESRRRSVSSEPPVMTSLLDSGGRGGRRRLVDYVVVVGYDRERFRRKRRRPGEAGGGGSKQAEARHQGPPGGKVLQRFPTVPWPDTPFIGECGQGDQTWRLPCQCDQAWRQFIL